MKAQRIPRRSRPQDDEGHILPLINIVFLLLIFFMVVGRLSTFEPFPVAPPASRSQGTLDVGESVILISRDGQVALDGNVLDDGALKSAVAALLESNQSMPIRLKADGRADSVRVVAVMEMLREAGVRQVSLLTLEQGP